jgi:hypothetical protein
MKLVLLTVFIASQVKHNGMKWSDWHLKMLYQILNLLKVRMEMSKDMDGKVKCGGGAEISQKEGLYPICILELCCLGIKPTQ